MRIYRIVKMLAVGPGTVVKLDDAQAKRRTHRLEALGEGRYLTKDVMQFKAGEIVGLEGELPKVQLDQVEPVDQVAQAADESSALGLNGSAQPGGMAGRRRR